MTSDSHGDLILVGRARIGVLHHEMTSAKEALATHRRFIVELRTSLDLERCAFERIVDRVTERTLATAEARIATLENELERAHGALIVKEDAYEKARVACEKAQLQLRASSELETLAHRESASDDV